MEKTKVTTNDIIEIAQKIFDVKTNIRTVKVNLIIEFFGIQNMTDLTDVIVCPMLYETFKTYFGDVINVSKGFYFDDGKYFEFLNLPKLTIKDFLPIIRQEEEEINFRKNYLMSFSSGIQITDNEGIPVPHSLIKTI